MKSARISFLLFRIPHTASALGHFFALVRKCAKEERQRYKDDFHLLALASAKALILQHVNSSLFLNIIFSRHFFTSFDDFFIFSESK